MARGRHWPGLTRSGCVKGQVSALIREGSTLPHFIPPRLPRSLRLLGMPQMRLEVGLVSLHDLRLAFDQHHVVGLFLLILVAEVEAAGDDGLAIDQDEFAVRLL